jgi:hypothetical protein
VVQWLFGNLCTGLGPAASMTTTCILVDLENVQLKAPELAGLKRGEHLLKIFHGPSQNSFTAAMVRALQPLGDAVEYIQCEKAGPNALDFHLAFHLGRLTASQPALDFRIVSRDKGFAQLVAHATRLGHRVSQHASLQWPGLLGASQAEAPVAQLAPAPKPERVARPTTARKAAVKVAVPASKKAAPAKAPRAAAKAALDVPVAKKAPARKAAAKKAPAAKKVAPAAAPPAAPAKAGPRDVATAADQQKALASLRKLGSKLPVKQPALAHYLESHLRNDLTPAGVQALMQWWMASGVLKLAGGKLSYQLPG